jgi:DNA polymerase III subunit alpha
MPKFTHLHVHSHYSLLDGLPKIDELLDYTKELGMDSVAITDHGVMYGAIEFYKKAKTKGIKPIIGCEVYTAFEKLTDKRPNIDARRNHLILLAKNEQGYKNLVKLVTIANLDGFYYKPRIDEEVLERYAEGLIGLSACIQGKIPRLLLANKNDEAEEIAKKYEKFFGKGNFYLELQHHPNIPDQITANKRLIELSKKTGIPLVATNDIHYLRKEDSEAQDVLMLINTGADANDPERLSMLKENFSMISPEEMIEYFKDVPEAIENTQKIADACNVTIELGKTKLPIFPLPEGKTAEEYLEEICWNGIEARYGKNPDQKVTDRLKYELSVVGKTGFAGYFLIVQEFVKWAKDNRIIVGPGRGSAGGSIVAYLSGITNVDPLKHNLLFERFLNPERISMPDIDLDFADRRRDEVIKHVAEKYGQDHVAQIITFGTMAARAVIRDVGRALQYTYSYCDQLAKMVPMGMDLAEALEKVDEFKEKYETDELAKRLINLGKKLEGVARHASTHACGVVISAKPLTESVPLQRPPKEGDEGIITQYEMHGIEDLGLLKMDFLGLKNLTIIEDTLARIYVLHNNLKIDLDKIPYDDEITYKLLQEALTTSVFQLESDGMKRYLKELVPSTFEDITAMVALYRPGPMQFIPDYIERKHGNQTIKYIHPKLEPILRDTYGICIYQEQLMKIAQEVCGFTLGEADVLRKAVGKKIKELLDAQETKFINGAIENGASKKVAEELWQWILPFAAYGFNKSHSAAYATIAYQTAYLKAHYPVEFMASVLTSERADVERIAFLIDECKKMEVEVLAPNINESLKNFTVVAGKNQIRFGLLAIKNVGVNIIDAVTEERKANGHFKSIGDFIHRVKSKDLNKKSMDALIKAGAFDEFAERNQLLTNLEKMLEIARENTKKQNTNQMGLFSSAKMSNNDIKLEKANPASNFEKLGWEKELLGLYVSSHPLNGFKKLFESKTTPISKIDASFVDKKVILGGLISSVKKIITKTGKPMLFMKLEDLSGKTEIVVFPNLLDRNPVALQENKIVFIAGRVDDRNGEIKVVADDVQEIVVPKEDFYSN